METTEAETIPSESLVLRFTPSEDIQIFEPTNERRQPKIKKEKINNKPNKTHYRTASNSLTVGGYGLYNIWSDGDITADEEHSQSHSPSRSFTPQPEEYNNTNQHTDIVNHKNNKQQPKDALEIQIVLAEPKQKNKENKTNQLQIRKQKNNFKHYIYTTLHYFGLLSLSHLIANDANIKHYTDLLQAFSEMRFYINKYYLISEDKIFKEIESFIVPEKTKIRKLSNCWHDLIDTHCFKHLYILPVIFGWIEMFLIVYINVVFILIIFNYSHQLYYFKRILYNLSLSLMIIVGLHCIGIIYQKILSSNQWELNRLKEYKKKFTLSELNYKNDLNEKYISLQKWFNCLIVTADKNYTGHFIRCFIQKYLFLLLIAVGTFCVLHLLQWNERNIVRKVEKFYVIFQLIIFPIWWVFIVFGVKKCLKFKVLNKKYCVVLVLYFILFAIVSIHSYAHIKFFDPLRFFEGLTAKIMLFAFLVLLNPFLLFGLLWKLKISMSFMKNKYSKYYLINMLSIYLCVTIKIFMDENIITNNTTLQLVQNVLKVMIYCLISISNVIYYSAINIKYFENNGIVIVRRLIFSFWSLFLCNYKIQNFCYETDWHFDKNILQPIVTNDIDDDAIMYRHDSVATQTNNVTNHIDVNNDFDSNKETYNNVVSNENMDHL